MISFDLLTRKTLQAGSSKPGPETLEAMTGSRKMDASAMLEYFKPLSDWLDQVRNRNTLFPDSDTQ